MRKTRLFHSIVVTTDNIIILKIVNFKSKFPKSLIPVALFPIFQRGDK